MRGDELKIDAAVPRHVRMAIERTIKENNKLFSETCDVLRKCVVEIHNLLGSTETYYVTGTKDPGIANDNPLLISYEALMHIDVILGKCEDIFVMTDHHLSLHPRMLKKLERHLVHEHADREILHSYLDKYKKRRDEQTRNKIHHLFVRIRKRFLEFPAFSDWSNAEMHEVTDDRDALSNIHAFNQHRLKEIEALHTYVKGLLGDGGTAINTSDHVAQFLPYQFTLAHEKQLLAFQDAYAEHIDEMLEAYERFLEIHRKIRHIKLKCRTGIDEDFEVERKVRMHYMEKEYVHAVKQLIKPHKREGTFYNEKSFLRHLHILQDNYLYDLHKMSHAAHMVLEHLGNVHTRLQRFNESVLADGKGSHNAMISRLNVLKHIDLMELSIFSLGSLRGLVRQGLERLEVLREEESAIFEELLELEHVLEHLYTDKHREMLHDSILEAFLHKTLH